jgi:hypothetical protein
VGRDRFAFHPLKGFDYFLRRSDDLVDYVTIFTIGDAMRVNVFTQWQPRDPRVRAFMDAPVPEMERYFPGVMTHTGPFEVASRVQSVPVEFHRLQGVDVPGVIVVGYEFQPASPATGTDVTTDSVDPPDLVIADIARVDPDEVVDAWPDVPILGYTNHTDKSGLQRAHTAGFDQVLVKSALVERCGDLVTELTAPPP